MDIRQFYIIGINYKKSDASIRGDFAINGSQYETLLQKASETGIREIFVLSTCNRTEVYAIAPDAATLIHLLCSATVGSSDTFRQICYTKQGVEAIRHLFAVGAGLDSQILGDYEIVGQLKLAVKFSKERGCIGGFTERLFNTVLQSSKSVKNETALSGGTISVSFAAIQFLKENCPNIQEQKIVLLGTGKIGKNTCKNLMDYLDTKNITLLNRTEEKATELAAELGLRTVPFVQMQKEVNDASIVIVATHSDKAIITRESLQNSSPKILIDLSIPNNVEPSAGSLPHIQLVNVDDLSLINDKTLAKRQAEVPRANTIIEGQMAGFLEWLDTRRHAPVLKAVKEKLQEMYSSELFISLDRPATQAIDNTAIQKAVNTVAVKLRSHHQPGCYYIEAINDFMTTSVN